MGRADGLEEGEEVQVQKRKKGTSQEDPARGSADR